MVSILSVISSATLETIRLPVSVLQRSPCSGTALSPVHAFKWHLTNSYDVYEIIHTGAMNKNT
ncbi:protein of unknown function [Aminobacter niigataensis]|nr:protein of unknown function [Aminobacter niigataensis]